MNSLVTKSWALLAVSLVTITATGAIETVDDVMNSLDAKRQACHRRTNFTELEINKNHTMSYRGSHNSEEFNVVFNPTGKMLFRAETKGAENPEATANKTFGFMRENWDKVKIFNQRVAKESKEECQESVELFANYKDSTKKTQKKVRELLKGKKK